MVVSRTNRKRWIGLCDRCGWLTLVQPFAVHAAVELAEHLRTEHHLTETQASRESGLYRKDPDMGIKQPTEELPEQEGGVRLGDYVGKLVVFDNATEHKDTSSFGTRDTVHAELWVFDPGNEVEGTRQANADEWVSPGEVIVWFVTVGKQIMAELPDQLAGILTKGTDRNVNEWAITPVPTKAKAMVNALATWDPSF